MTQAERAQALINRHRRAQGLKPLRRAEDLTTAALNHALDMVTHGYFDHRNFSQRQPDRYRSAGEVIHWQTWRPESHNTAVEGWMDSPPHRRILMDGKYTHLGLGRYYHRPAGRIYWVGIVGRL